MRLNDYPAERLLLAETRRGLGFMQMVALWLNPFLLFKDASIGDVFSRSASYRYNRGLRNILPTYMRRWLMVLLLCNAGCLLFEALIDHHPLFALPLGVSGIGMAWAMIWLMLMAAGWLVLRFRSSGPVG